VRDVKYWINVAEDMERRRRATTSITVLVVVLRGNWERADLGRSKVDKSYNPWQAGSVEYLSWVSARERESLCTCCGDKRTKPMEMRRGEGEVEVEVRSEVKW
jgi:hypothetical protein